MPASLPIHAASRQVAPDSFPRWVLLTAGGVLAFTLISVGLVRLTGNGPDQRAASTVATGRCSVAARSFTRVTSCALLVATTPLDQ
jgi:hypothetical protein